TACCSSSRWRSAMSRSSPTAASTPRCRTERGTGSSATSPGRWARGGSPTASSWRSSAAAACSPATSHAGPRIATSSPTACSRSEGGAMARIAVGGFQHETNSFAPTPTRLADFIAADGWPGLSRGDVLFDAVAGINLPAAGFVAAAREAGHSLVPLPWCAAPPLSLVEAAAYERIAEMLLADLAAAGPLDALSLDLHGAMIGRAAGLFRPVAAMEETASPSLAGLSFATGFPPADIAETGPAVIAYGDNQAAADRAAAALTASVRAAEPDFAGKVWSPDTAVAEALRLAAPASRPVILADTQDNPGAGTDSDTIWLTDALLRRGASAAVGLICDPA